MTAPCIEVVEIATGKVVDTIPLSSDNERTAERVMAGLLINMNTAEYYVREVLK